MYTAVGIAFLLVYVLGAFAYGSALVLSLRQASPVWSPHRHHGSALRPRLDRASVAMFRGRRCGSWWWPSTSSTSS